MQIIAVPALLVSVWQAAETPLTKPTQTALAFCLAILAVSVIQLIPLPPWLWTLLPGRDASAAAFDLLGRTLPWMPISVAPNATWLSAFSLLPPLAIFVSAVLLDLRERRTMSLIVIAVGIVSVFLGLLQVAQGPSSSLRFFEITNPSEAVGFFANRNHFAALLYAVLLFAAAWAIDIAASEGPKLKQFDVRATVLTIGGFVILVVLLSGQAMARSRAGVGLTIIALFGALALAFSDRRAVTGVTPAKLLLGAGAVAIMFAAQYALYRILERFEADPLEDARIAFARNTFAAAKTYMPFGSGLGSFVSVYGLFERPQDAMADTFANHAHNDVLELCLETGAAGLALVSVFVVWFVWRAATVWRELPKPELRNIDRLLARAATIVIALLIAHSFVDYPLRTSAMTAIIAFACALLLDPPARATQRRIDAEAIEALLRRHNMPAPARSLKSSPTLETSPASLPAALPGRSSGERWGADIDWPEAWRKPAKDASTRAGNSPPKSPKSRDQ